MFQAHLSHNSIGADGIAALLAAIPVTPLPHPDRRKGLWLRIEWNQVMAPLFNQPSIRPTVDWLISLCRFCPGGNLSFVKIVVDLGLMGVSDGFRFLRQR